MLKQHWVPFSSMLGAISKQKNVVEKTWNFAWLDIDSSLQTNHSKWLDSDSTWSWLWLWLEKILDDTDSKGLWLWLDKNDSDTSLGCKAVGYAVGRRTIAALCYAYIYGSKHIFGLCIILAYQVKSTQISFDTYYPCISNCWVRPRDLQKIVYFNWWSTCRKLWEPLV